MKENYSFYDYLKAYAQLINNAEESQSTTNRINLLGWDIEYIDLMALAGYIDQLLIRQLNDFISDNDFPVIIDCGANIGLGVLNYKRKYPDSRVIAFEPDPEFLPRLRNNLNRNNLSNVELVESAAWIENGEASWYSEGVDGSKIVQGNGTESFITVPTCDLSDYINEPIDLLKMDIEGAEYTVIEHIKDKLSNVKNIIVECHLNQSNMLAFTRLIQTLVSSGYNLCMNTIGVWRDLTRQSLVAPDHWEQYPIIVGWRKPINRASLDETYLPYVGVKGFLNERDGMIGKAAIDLIRTGVINTTHNIVNYVLKGPFGREKGNVWICRLPDSIPIGDSEEEPARSEIMFFEGENVLGPPHSIHKSIRDVGSGQFSHWQNVLYFSTSDNTDPNCNGRTYQVVFSRPLDP